MMDSESKLAKTIKVYSLVWLLIGSIMGSIITMLAVLAIILILSITNMV